MALVSIASALAVMAVALAEPVTTLQGGHSHNDYNRKRPLLDALEVGLGSLEADLCLVDGELRVAHEVRSSKKGRTLQSLYLQPLWKRFQEMGKKVTDDGKQLTLLVDIKTDADKTYAALKVVLDPYRPMLSSFDEEGRKGSVQVIVSGNVPRKAIQEEAVRWVAIDGRVDDLETNPPADLVPWVSASWLGNFQWLGLNEMGDEDRQRLKDWVTKAHAQGRKLRFWATPDVPVFWKELRAAGVDIIGTDNPGRLATFLRETPQPETNGLK